MVPTIIIGVLFSVIIFFALKKTLKAFKSNTCVGCSCGDDKKSQCPYSK